MNDTDTLITRITLNELIAQLEREIIAAAEKGDITTCDILHNAVNDVGHTLDLLDGNRD